MAENKSTSIRKRMILRLLKLPDQGNKTGFWPREMKMAKSLLEEFPSEEFWEKVTFPSPLPSFAFLKTSSGYKELTRRYKEFFYKPVDTSVQIKIEDRKFGEDRDYKKPQTLKDLLR